MASSDKYIQFDFSGGMSAAFDATKTLGNSYRLGINCRARKNSIDAAYKPTKFNTPNAIHQALFVNDDKLMLVAGGELYVLVGESFQRIEGFSPLDADVDVVYHESVPAPNNFFVNGEYKSVVATTPECVVLQDGVNVPRLVLSNLTTRLVKTYGEWSFESPEYVPIGKQMAFSGNVLYVVSVDGKRIYQSVAGRPLDFTLNINNDGSKRGDADTSYLAVSAAKLVSIVAAQNGGLVGFSRYRTYGLTPQPGVNTIFGQVYMQPSELFPAGAVNHTAFTQANGETLFVSSRGINKFNEVQQSRLESNLSPFGAPIVDYIVRPIKRIACATLDDYTFFGLQTVFGDGVLVYDNQLQSFVGIDLVGAVKEFAVLQDDGSPRLFYLTHTNELYEYNLFSGEKMDYGVYLGEFTPVDQKAGQGYPLTQLRPTSVEVSLSNISSEGSITVELFVDKQTRNTVTKPVKPLTSVGRVFKSTPVSIPLEGNTDVKTYTFNFSNEPFGFSAAAFILCTADSRIVSAAITMDKRELAAAPDNIVDTLAEHFVLAGNWRPDSVTIDSKTFEVEVGKRYFWFGESYPKLLNGNKEVTTRAPNFCSIFGAAANVLYGDESGMLLDYSTCQSILKDASSHDAIIGLGDYGYQLKFGHFQTLLESVGCVFYGVSGEHEWTDDSTAKDYSSKMDGLLFRIVERRDVRFFLCSFKLNHAQIELDETGNIESTPDEMLESGTYAQRIETHIKNAPSKINIVCFHLSPRKYAALAWNFKRLGVHAVFSAHDVNYSRVYEDGVYYINAGTADGLNINGDVQVAGAVHLDVRDGFVTGSYVDVNGEIHDRFSLTR